MKTKIFVCSNSSIDYLPHNEMISSIPVILKVSDNEMYEDYIDVNIEAFYNRIRMDKYVKVTPVFQNYTKISEYINEVKAQGYQQVLFLLSANIFSDLYISISIAMSEHKDIKYVIFDSESCGYPLSYMATEASNLLLSDESLDDILNHLEFLKNNQKIYFYKYEKINEMSKSFLKKYKKGKLLKLTNGKLDTVNTSKMLPLDFVIEELKNKIDKTEIIPFLMYTDKTTRYINIIEEELIKSNIKFKRIKIVPIAPGVGIKVGVNTIAIGYIVK